MKTIYITGIKKYKKSLQKGLEKSNLVKDVDYIEGSGGSDYALYWLKDSINLRTFKLEIGAKYVWKHRMRFYDEFEDMKPEVEEPEYSVTEILEKIKKSRNDARAYEESNVL